MSDLAAVAQWFETERGITRETLKAYGITFDRGNVCIPYPNGVKERPDPTVQLPPEKRRFYFTPGRTPVLLEPPGWNDQDTAFICEGETDAMRLWQELGGDATAIPVFGLGGINTWSPACVAQLEQFRKVAVVLDNDQDYKVTGRVDAAWRQIRKDLGGRAKRVHLPSNIKDVCQFFQDGYDLDALREIASRSGRSRFRPVDFLQPPPPVRWLVEGLIALGDVTMIAGVGGLGKSFLTMDLSLATLDGRAEWLGLPMVEHGKVLYVDEENPLDVVHHRLRKMGLDPAAHAGQLRYLWNQAVRLDKDPDTLLDEALDFAPTLIVIDSQTRVHTLEENNSGEISKLFNDAIKPLARETGAAVVLIHHHDKGAHGPRGSSDIKNSVDSVIDLYDQGLANPGKFLLRVSKTRRSIGGTEIKAGIIDQPDGTIQLVVDPVVNPPF